MGNVIAIKGVREAPKSQQNRMETVILSIDQVNQWKIPPFQRPLRVNQRVMEVSADIKNNEQIEGVITVGKIRTDNAVYVIDGQHRLEAFRLSGATEVIADLRQITFNNMAEMSDEFVRLNGSLVKMRPDDILRGMEGSIAALAAIRKACDFVGYDQVRRGGASGPVLSMSTVIRCWTASGGETPSTSSSGLSAAAQASNLDQVSQQSLTSFLAIAHAAWGRDPEYFRLWGSLNLTICMWLWRRLVIDRDRTGNKRHVVLSATEFKQCLMSVSADGDYLSWLPGRNMGDRDRSPCYTRVKSIFVRRVTDIYRGDRKKAVLPAPAWASK